MSEPASDTAPKGQLSLAKAALFACGPRCGARPLFAGLVRFVPQCEQCGLDYAGFNVGDGPAAYLTLIVGSVVTGLAIGDMAAAPPAWLHILIWVPVTIAAVLGGLRVAKALLLFAKYRNRAGDGRLRSDAQP